MSDHSDLFGSAAGPLLAHHFGDRGIVTYIPPDGRDAFDIDDAIIGSETSLDERDTGGDMTIRRVAVTVPTKRLEEKGIHEVQAWGKVKLGSTTYDISLTESQYGRFFTTIQCILKKRQRQQQFRGKS